MSDRILEIDRISVPRFLYGTAWKEQATQRLIELALEAGFRGIDTANQRRHYNESAVGEAISAAIEKGLITRDELFVQTKYTFRQGQDHRLPYDPAATIAAQVEQSFASSLQHLGIDRIDAYLLHGPMTQAGLTAADWEAWRAIEAIHNAGRARLIGVSNFSREQLEELCAQARVAPSFVQNRCYAATGWDRRVRDFCAQHRITYQGFSLLTANRQVLGNPDLVRIGRRHDRSVIQIIFRFAIEVGMIPLTGTTNVEHMRADLEVFEFRLEPDEIARVERLAVSP